MKLPRALLVVDTETTGLDPRTSYVHQVGGLFLIHGQRIGMVNRRLRVPPWAILTPGFRAAQKVHGIPTRDLLKGQSPRIFCRNLARFVARIEHAYRVKPVLAAQNVAFDAPMLQATFRRAGVPWPFGHRYFDIPTLASFVLGGTGSTRDAYPKLGIKNEKEHDALADACASAEALLALERRANP